jgi:predicted NAD/FAD-dependent oxidoreductase
MMNKGMDIIIVGAGIAGLVAAVTLQKQGYQAIILEQSPVVGGRLASYPLQNGLADYGTQFFTSRTAVFQEQVDSWMQSGLVYIWSDEWSDGSIKRTKSDSPCYATYGGMYQLAKHLSDKVKNTYLSTSVKTIRWDNNRWFVVDSNDIAYTSRVLIVTPPVPESLALLSDVPLAPNLLKELNRIYYEPCLCGLFVVDGGLNLPPSGAIQDFSKPVYWIADNQKKGISDQTTCITMHFDKQYSEKHFDDADEDILRYLRNELEQYLSSNTTIESEVLKKWRYSIPLTTYPHDYLKVDALPLIFAGDAFGGRGRVEGAYLSGLAAAKAAENILSIHS